MPAPPYPTLEAVVSAARVRLNDAIASINGDVLTDNAAFTLPAINQAWQRLQEFLAESNAPRLINPPIVLTGLAAAVSNDPGVFGQLNWAGYTAPGGTLNAAIALPQDMIFPLRLWERVSGSNAPFTPMEDVLDGAQNMVRKPRNYSWQWRADSIILPGSTVPMDLQIEYAAFLADFVPNTTTAFSAQTVPIVRALDSLAWYICSEMANARGDMDGKDFDAKAEAAAKRIIDRATRMASLRSQWTIPDIPAATGDTHYDSVSTILNAVRVRMNKVNTLAGDALVASNPFTQQCFNNGWRKMQEFLANLGDTRFTDETILTAIPVVTSIDPASQVSLSWSGFFDGTTQQATPVLPEILSFPLKIWERQTGQNAAFCDPGMENMLDGLPTFCKSVGNRFWEWRNDAIFMPGSIYPMDLRIRFAKFLPDFVQVGATPWYLQPVKLSRCQDALALYVCAEVALARPDLEMDPMLFKESAEQSAGLIFNRNVRAKQRVNVRRRSQSGRLEGANNWAYGCC